VRAARLMQGDRQAAARRGPNPPREAEHEQRGVRGVETASAIGTSSGSAARASSCARLMRYDQHGLQPVGASKRVRLAVGTHDKPPSSAAAMLSGDLPSSVSQRQQVSVQLEQVVAA